MLTSPLQGQGWQTGRAVYPGVNRLSSPNNNRSCSLTIRPLFGAVLEEQGQALGREEGKRYTGSLSVSLCLYVSLCLSVSLSLPPPSLHPAFHLPSSFLKISSSLYPSRQDQWRAFFCFMSPTWPPLLYKAGLPVVQPVL